MQDGAEPAPDRRDQRDRRYLQTPRDLAHYVHFDALYEAYLNAALILLGQEAPVDAGNPYSFSGNQIGFGTYGGPHILSLVTEVATRALKAVWFQKWCVHRRLRPEEFGGRIDVMLSGKRGYPIDREVLEKPVVPAANGTALIRYTGPDADRLTVGGELNKVAANVAIGRSMAGVHWRTDYSEAVRLGEEVAIGLLREVTLTTLEDAHFTLSRFDGTTMTI